jgi:hypothetical protein
MVRRRWWNIGSSPVGSVEAGSGQEPEAVGRLFLFKEKI